MEGRVRLCPYYFVNAKDESVSLGGVLATICPADKKILHGMRDAILGALPNRVLNVGRCGIIAFREDLLKSSRFFLKVDHSHPFILKRSESMFA